MGKKEVIEELPERKTTISIDIRTKNTLKRLKKENETYNDIIKQLLKERTQEYEEGQAKLTIYGRKTAFVQTEYRGRSAISREKIGVEFEYNDLKSVQEDFTIDLKFKKIFFRKKIYNPSEFFGVDSARKHLNKVYLNIYLRCVEFVLKKEFKVRSYMLLNNDFESIALWRHIYYEYSLSEDSFKEDIEDPLRLSEEEQPDQKTLKRIESSPSRAIL